MVLAASGATAFAQTFSGYAQVDYLWTQDSEDQLSDDTGDPLNQTQFLLRRARLRMSGEHGHLDYTTELDVSTARGPQLGIRHVEAGVFWPRRDPSVEMAPVRALPLRTPAAQEPESPGTPSPEASSVAPDPGAPPAPAPSPSQDGSPPSPRDPSPGATNERPARSPPAFRVRFGAGIIRAPFGHDVSVASHATRLFSEPSLLAQALFPGEFDLGAQLSLSVGPWSFVVAAQNGEPLGTRPFPGRDPNAAKDFFARVGGRGILHERLRVEGALSTMFGTGFHPGTAGTKDSTVWRDYNEDGIVQLNELTAIPGASATPSENFERWGFGGDVRVIADLPFVGTLTVFAEAALASNLDRAIRPADPVALGRAQRTVAAYAGFTQEIGELAVIGFRYDFYEPSLDETDLEGGVLVRSVQRFQNFSVAAGMNIGSIGTPGRARLMAEYSHRRDPLGRDAAGRATDLANDTATARLQVEF